MKFAVVCCVFFFAALAVARHDADHYTDRYDNVDLDEILSNERLLLPYIKCILNQGKCAADAKELKEHLIEAIENDCLKCTEKQRKGSWRVIEHLVNKAQDYWNELIAKYDPVRKFRTKYKKKLREIKT